MTRISVFTPTRGEDKLPYLFQALIDLQAQTFGEWEWFILDNAEERRHYLARVLDSADERVKYVYDNDFDRSQVHAMPYLLNKYYPQATGDLIFYLSDDDRLDPALFSTFVSWFDKNPDTSAAWVSLGLVNVTGPDDEGMLRGAIPAEGVLSAGMLDNRVDGGQIMHRKSCLDVIGQPYFPESVADESARHCDGQFMEKLAQHWNFYPVGVSSKFYVTHRFTPVSTFTPFHGPNGKIGV